MELNNKKTINGWAMYDWANSVYSLVITSTIFPVYYSSVTKGIDGSDIVSFFGFMVTKTVLYSYSLSFSFIFVALFLPLLSGIADYSGRKKRFLKIFAYMGSLACMGLFFYDGTNLEFGIICSIVASIGYSGGLVFYDAFLPEISSPDRFDMVSAKGYSLGYIGSVILLVFNIVMLSKPELFFLADDGEAARVSFLIVGLWWAGFAQITFSRLPDNVYNRKRDVNIFRNGYLEVRKVWRSLSELPYLKRFLLAFFFYNMGVQTVMYMAALFGEKELKLPGDKLILTILIINLVAIGGSYLFAFISKIKGNKFSLMTMVVLWVLICISAYFVNIELQFYALAFVVGLVMGGIQSLSRATYSKLIPSNTIDHASYFSFYDVLYNLSIGLGTFTYGFIEQLTGSMRDSTLVLAVFFIIGFIFLSKVQVPKNRIRLKTLDV